MNQPNIHVVGIGSWHGADAAGWLAVQQLAEQWQQAASDRPNQEVAFHWASTPQDLLDWIQPQHSVHVVDACLLPSQPHVVPTVKAFRVLHQDATLKLSAFQPAAHPSPATSAPLVGRCGCADGVAALAPRQLASGDCPEAHSLFSRRENRPMQATNEPNLVLQEPEISLPSHRLELTTVLQLAAVLKRFPQELVLWPIPVVTTGDSRQPGPDFHRRVERVSGLLYDTLCRIGTP